MLGTHLWFWPNMDNAKLTSIEQLGQNRTFMVFASRGRHQSGGWACECDGMCVTNHQIYTNFKPTELLAT